MDETWHSLTSEYSPSPNEMGATISVGAQSLWFEGHFPGMPILPGIAQLVMVSDIIRRNTDHTGIAELKRVRFRLLLRPEMSLQIVITPDASSIGLFRFKIFSGEDIACNGAILMK